VTPELRHGFTGHEMLAELGLIHMNGRLYDPAIGRFLSADPSVQYPDDLQNYNRYSYINNNPLSAIDPSGFGFLSSLFKGVKKLVKSVVKAVKHVLRNPVVRTALAIAATYYFGVYNGGIFGASTASMTSAGPAFVNSFGLSAAQVAVANGAAAGFAGGFIASGGNFKAGLIGGLTGAAFGGVQSYYGNEWSFERVLSNATVGGTSSTLQGDNFKDGFFFSGINASARYLYNYVVTYDTNWAPGGDAISKEPFTMPNPVANNIGEASLVINTSSWWGEGGIVSRFANRIPGINAVAGMHDVFQVRLDQWGGNLARNVFNVPGMIPAASVSYAGLFDGSMGIALRVRRY